MSVRYHIRAVAMRPSSPTLASLVALLACTAPKPEREPPTVYRSPPVVELAPTSTPAPLTPAPAPEPVAPVTIEPPHCASIERPPGSLEFVRQVDIDLPERFDPSGEYGASGAQSCEVWSLYSGVYVGLFGGPRASGECVAWPAGEPPCSSWPKLEQLYLGTGTYSRSTDGSRFAIVRSDLIELRELETGALLAELSLDRPTPPGGKLLRWGIGWSGGMPVALLGRCNQDVDADECDSEDQEPIWELRRWANIGAPVETTLMSWDDEGQQPAWIKSASIDPLGRWLFAIFHWDGDHDTPTERRQFPLTREAAKLGADMAGRWIDGVPDRYDRYGLEPWGLDDGNWISGSRTARWSKIERSQYDGEGSGSDTLSWAAFELSPSPRRTGPHQLADDSFVEEQKLEVFGVGEGEGEGAGVLAWSHCWPPEERASLLQNQELDDVGEDGCRGQSPVPKGCEARGISHELDWLLVACDPNWKLLPLGTLADVLEPVELANAEDGKVTAVFGRSGLALAGARGTKLLGPNGQPRATIVDFVELLPATLGPELDRAVARGPAGLTVLDLATAERITSMPSELVGAAITQLAFAPDGRRLAWSDSHRITVWDIEAGAVAASWDAGSVLGLAWRQDGAVLLSGSERALPEHAWDPSTGKLAPAQPDQAFLARLALADLDPSWRWAFEGEDVILRVVDGLALYLEDHEIVVTETGLYDGGGSDLWVRVVGQPGVFELDSLPARLRHPGLLEDFLAGKPLPTPILVADELTKR
jgi:hypothetical protein